LLSATHSPCCRSGFFLYPLGSRIITAHGTNSDTRLDRLLYLFPEAEETGGGERTESEIFGTIQEQEIDTGFCQRGLQLLDLVV
jgi:hypothetical protein